MSPDESLEPVRLASVVASKLFEHAVECYPEECCGLMVGREDEPAARVVRCTNVQSRRKSRGESDLDARHGFWIDEQELFTSLREAERRGETLRAVYHSHIDGAAYLSATDVAWALGPAGEPLWPGVSQFVVSVWDDGVRDVACFDWDRAARGFVGRKVQQVTV
jgi:proteasome lid subunit RPN8/RPN11